jgi:hypothetical protein
LSSPLKQFFLRETRDGLRAFSGADLSRARFLTRSSKTLDREHRWNNAGFEKARVERRKNGGEKDFGQEHRIGDGLSATGWMG